MAPGGLTLLIVLAVVAALIFRIWRATTLPRDAPREPACGACGYPVRGLGSLSCPECGADLREAGILTPQMLVRWRGSTAGLVTAWTLVVLVIGLPLAMFVGSAALKHMDQRERTSLVSDLGGYGVDVEVHSRGREGNLRTRSMTLRLERGGAPAGELHVEPSLEYRGRAPDGSETIRGERLDADAIMRWLASEGVQADPATASGLAAAVRASTETPAIRQTPVAGLRTAGGGSTTMSTVPGWYWAVAFSLLGAVWAAGTYLLLRGRRALLRSPPPKQETAA